MTSSPRPRQLFKLALSLALIFYSGALYAQSVTVGVLLPLTGQDAVAGSVVRTTLEKAAAQLARRGVTLTLSFFDESGAYATPDAPTRLANEAIDALICCLNAPPERVASELPTLSLSAAPPEAHGYLALAPSPEAPLEHLRDDPQQAPIGLLAPSGAAGDRAAAQLHPAGVVRYPAGAAPLTPEALRLATQTPRTVVIWDDAAGTLEAARALSARGYEGVQVVRADLWEELSVLERAELSGSVSVITPVVLGYALSDAHPSKPMVASLRRALYDQPASHLTAPNLQAAGLAWDAAHLLAAAAEQSFAYGITPATTSRPAMRQALSDSLVGQSGFTGAAGSYDFSAGGVAGFQAASLVMATFERGVFRPRP